MPDSTFLTRVSLENYKSIQHCDVQMRSLMFLVGPNGAGKSNFLDALHFISDALNTSLDYALRQRNGFDDILTVAPRMGLHFSIRLEFHLPTGETGHYTFQIGVNEDHQAIVQTEECRIYPHDVEKEVYFRVAEGEVTTSEAVTPIVVRDRLYLVAASGLPAFRPLYDALSHMAFYNLSPEKIREVQTPGGSDLLSHNGDNITGVWQRIKRQLPDTMQRIREYLAVIVPGIQSVDVENYGTQKALKFIQQLSDRVPPLRFHANSMSDGTLRALGILVALFQTADSNGLGVSLIVYHLLNVRREMFCILQTCAFRSNSKTTMICETGMSLCLVF